MKHHHMLAVLLAFLFINIGLANAISVPDDFIAGVKFHVDSGLDMAHRAETKAAP